MRSRPRRLAGILASLGLAGLAACGEEGPLRAIGPNDDISVITHLSENDPSAREIRRLFAYPVEVVGKEPAFQLDFVPFRDFSLHRRVKNQIVAVDLSTGDDLARAVPDMLGPVAEGKLERRVPFLHLTRDLWAVGQTSLFAVAWSNEDLRRLFALADSSALRRDYEDAVVAGLVETMFSQGEEEALARQVADRFGWTMRLLPGFFTALDAPGRVVKFNAADPVRLLVVHWEDREIPLAALDWEPVMSRLLRTCNDGDFVLADRTEIVATHFQRQPALRWDGVWQNEKYVIGGPFRAFAFHRGGYSYLLVGIVYAPSQDKIPALRQVEALLSTFHVVS